MSAGPNPLTSQALRCAAAGACDRRQRPSPASAVPVACFRPIHGYRAASGEFTLDPRQSHGGDMQVPCGRCIGCRVSRSRMWALRCVHEAQLHEQNCFITLTYAPEHLPPDGSLRYRDFQLFMKRLRKAARVPVRYFVCGEYGAALSRPHYHACVFGWDFSADRQAVTQSGPGSFVHYSSAQLSSLWGLGYVDITDLNVSSAAYAARYILKKVLGRAADAHYSRVDGDGVVHSLEPEFARMSSRPGLGRDWFAQYQSDVSAGDSIVHNGAQYPVPAYYDKLRKRADAVGIAEVKAERELRAYQRRADSTPSRLAVREEVAAARLSQLSRKLES